MNAKNLIAVLQLMDPEDEVCFGIGDANDYDYREACAKAESQLGCGRGDKGRDNERDRCEDLYLFDLRRDQDGDDRQASVTGAKEDGDQSPDVSPLQSKLRRTLLHGEQG